MTLAAHIGWYPSKNSEAHLTINVFEAEENELVKWKKYAVEFCKSLCPFEIRLLKTGSYANGAFYISPDEPSSICLKEMMIDFHRRSPLAAGSTPKDPHMSIARQLKKEQLQDANELWGNRHFDQHFLCDNIALRKFDVNKKQYSVEERFYFNQETQLSLF